MATNKTIVDWDMVNDRPMPAAEKGAERPAPKRLHPSTFEYLQPTADQLERMQLLREAAARYASTLDVLLPDGADKTFVLRAHRSNAMWANVAITREADGTPRS